MFQKDLIDRLEDLRDSLDDIWGNIAYMEQQSQKKQILEDLTESCFAINALVAQIESEGVREC